MIRLLPKQRLCEAIRLPEQILRFLRRQHAFSLTSSRRIGERQSSWLIRKFGQTEHRLPVRARPDANNSLKLAEESVLLRMQKERITDAPGAGGPCLMERPFRRPA